ncbi:hypothetical protein BT69DRAFT_496224 [Atractiella rhizophila]|nr:hypothetical protein BT69DRAFT_496224 [Atractiella rhizophila]
MGRKAQLETLSSLQALPSSNIRNAKVLLLKQQTYPSPYVHHDEGRKPLNAPKILPRRTSPTVIGIQQPISMGANAKEQSRPTDNEETGLFEAKGKASSKSKDIIGQAFHCLVPTSVIPTQ